MMLRVLSVALTGILAFIPLSALAEDLECLNSADGTEAFNSGEMKHATHYTESNIGSVEVQRKYPQTYMFGQAKFFKGTTRSVVVCQYSNHVGFVATYLVVGVEPLDDIAGCETDSCKSQPHWRSEWTESSSEGPRGQDRLHVCVETVDGIVHPSTGCKFKRDTK